MKLSKVYVCILWKATRPTVRICIKTKYTLGLTVRVSVCDADYSYTFGFSVHECLFVLRWGAFGCFWREKSVSFTARQWEAFLCTRNSSRVSSNPPVRGFNTLSGGRGGRRRILTLPGQTMGVLLGITAPGGLRGADLWLAPSVTGVCWGFGVGLHRTLSYTALLLFCRF